MTHTAPSQTAPTRRYWILALLSSLCAFLLLVQDHGHAYRAAVNASAVIAAVLIAVGDARTGLIRNAWTAPFALGATVQVLIATFGFPTSTHLLLVSIASAIVAGVSYTAMGLLRWVGFGDVKFAISLGIIAPLLAGWLGLLVAPVALVIGALNAATRSIRGFSHSSAPHGPALAAAITILAVLSEIIIKPVG